MNFGIADYLGFTSGGGILGALYGTQAETQQAPGAQQQAVTAAQPGQAPAPSTAQAPVRAQVVTSVASLPDEIARAQEQGSLLGEQARANVLRAAERRLTPAERTAGVVARPTSEELKRALDQAKQTAVRRYARQPVRLEAAMAEVHRALMQGQDAAGATSTRAMAKAAGLARTTAMPSSIATTHATSALRISGAGWLGFDAQGAKYSQKTISFL